MIGRHDKPAPLLGIPPEHLDAVRGGMWEVVNGDGTAGASRLHVPGIEMCGKTGTAQVRKIAGSQRGQSGDWKYRDHGLFVFFAPFDNPRYAGSVVIEHGLGGARAAAPVAKDVLTYLFDQATGDGSARRARDPMGRHAARAHRAAPGPGRGRFQGQCGAARMISLGDHPAAARAPAVAADLAGAR